MGENYLRVTHVAIRRYDTGVVVKLPPPARHADLFRLPEMQDYRQRGMEDQGFVLSDGSFATRKAAKSAATIAGQLLPRASKLDELFSEDVW